MKQFESDNKEVLRIITLHVKENHPFKLQTSWKISTVLVSHDFAYFLKIRIPIILLYTDVTTYKNMAYRFTSEKIKTKHWFIIIIDLKCFINDISE